MWRCVVEGTYVHMFIWAAGLQTHFTQAIVTWICAQMNSSMPHVLYMFKMAFEELIICHLAVVRGDSAQMMACRHCVLYTPSK